MIYQISSEELKKIKAIDDAYTKLIKESNAKLKELRPDEDEILKESPSDEAFQQWLNAGSEEWREERKRNLELIRTSTETMRETFDSLYDAHFKEIADDPDAIVSDAYDEIERFIPERYTFYCNEFFTPNSHGFSARDVRATKDGFLLDAGRTISNITDMLVTRHIKGLAGDVERINLIQDYIIKIVDESPLTSSTMGELGGTVTKKPKNFKTTEETILAIRPKDYVTTVDRVTRKLFENKLTRPLDAQDGALWDVPLDGERGKIFARAAIDYRELIESGAISQLPNISSKYYILHDAIITQILAGNRKMSYEMVYRAMTGKVNGKVTVPEEMTAFIDQAMPILGSRVQLKFSGKNVNGDEIEIDFDEPLVTYSLGTGKINGKVVKKVITIPEDTRFDPLLLKWARANGNELDTRDITLLDVPRLNNGDESLLLKMCLYRRLIKMRNEFERKKGGKYELAANKRTIRYDYVYAELGLEDPDANKRRLVKDKIDRCMKYWTTKGLISGYEHKRDKSAGNNFYAVVVSFAPKK